MSGDAAEFLSRLTPDRFTEWYEERQVRENIREGKPYFNGPSPVPEPERHSPSQLLQCHRKIVYRQENAPEETDPPRGVFWIGERFEEDIVLPFLRQAVTGDDAYVRNSMWVDFTPGQDDDNVRIKGATDPVIVDRDSDPLLVTEVKTKESISSVSEPNKHHRAQLHAYMRGLSASDRHDKAVQDGVIVYGSRSSLDIEVYHVPFDEEFWDEVMTWVKEHTEFREETRLPPADPEYEWECKFCSYRRRCGKEGDTHEDEPPLGLLPGVNNYPESSVREYLNGVEGAQLTPTLAATYPELATEHPVRDWTCPVCGAAVDSEAVDIEKSRTGPEPPTCGNCANRGVLAYLQLEGPPRDWKRD